MYVVTCVCVQDLPHLAHMRLQTVHVSAALLCLALELSGSHLQLKIGHIIDNVILTVLFKLT